MSNTVRILVWIVGLAACTGAPDSDTDLEIGETDTDTDGEPALSAVACDASLGLTAQDNAEQDGNGFEQAWTAALDGDVVTLVWSGGCGDECAEKREIVLQRNADACPLFVSGQITQNDYFGGESTVTLSAEDVTLQDFDVASPKVSGIVDWPNTQQTSSFYVESF